MRTEQLVKPVLQTKDTAVCVLQDLKESTVRSVGTFPRLITLPAVGSIKTLVCDERDRVITCVFCRDLFYLTLKFSGLYKNVCLVKIGEKLFQTKLLSSLSHKTFRLLSSPVLLRISLSSEIISNAYMVHF